jgi:ATP-dependent RNA helicase RhlE
LTFHDFNLCAPLLDGLDSMGFEAATPIQAQVVPLVLEGKDVIATAQTGTGKTAAYLLPILDRISRNSIPHTAALIIAPTRELAQQIDQALQGFAYFTHASSIAVYGGSSGVLFEQEKRSLTDGASVIIATPGRLLSHLNLGYVKFDQLDFLVLDEADKMLDMGFYDDIMRIVSYLPKKRQNLCFSATMAPRMRELAKRITHNASEINIAMSKPAAGVTQEAFLVYDNQKAPLLVKLLKEKKFPSVIIFVSTKSGVKDLERELTRAKLSARAISSDLSQEEREQALLSFRNGTTKNLVATDILSRGIDVDNISLVVNYDVPHDAEDYVHRVGRTARAESTGLAITLVNEKDQHRFANIEKLIEQQVLKIALPPELGKGPPWEPNKKHHHAHPKKNFQRKKRR